MLCSKRSNFAECSDKTKIQHVPFHIQEEQMKGTQTPGHLRNPRRSRRGPKKEKRRNRVRRPATRPSRFHEISLTSLDPRGRRARVHAALSASRPRPGLARLARSQGRFRLTQLTGATKRVRSKLFDCSKVCSRAMQAPGCIGVLLRRQNLLARPPSSPSTHDADIVA